MIETLPKLEERAVLVALIREGQTTQQVTEYLDELAFLAETAGAITINRFTQKLQHPDVRYFVGSGKLEEIRQYNEIAEISTVIIDDEISPAQQRNLEAELKCKILDRTSLILDIFAQRAKTAQARAQVELAQLQYLLPRLKGLWTHLERQRGGIGMRGPGEKEIETDRRVINDKIAKLKQDLVVLDKQDETRRKTRGELVRVALVGYTNVGKSTMMNLLSKSDILAENILFATLDTTVRKVVIDNMPFLLSDTVGFIRKLPHHLVESFKSTLDEAKESDIIVHVVDASHENFRDQIDVVNQTLADLKVTEQPRLIVFNKMDLYKEKHFDKYLPEDVKAELLLEFEKNMTSMMNTNCVFISALEKENIETLRNLMILMVQDMYHKRYPYRSNFY
ncbi:MAG TPA: GTPase HflX [Chitinophagales bacterium]|nr:GTPase HflX [Chitinophagales bacterium]HMV03212.1 GTPase HflX [Chitinophagales bacterium]HNK89869.1 GTPase HflX [Chitinophagales bacterium]